VSLDAPARVTVDGRELEFYAWETGGSRSASTHLLFEVPGDATLAARYRVVPPDTVTLTVTALCDGCATGLVSLAGLPVTVGAPWVGMLKTPYSFSMPRNGTVSLTAPSAVLVGGRTFRFAFWMSITDWRWLTSSTTLRGLADRTETLAPVYRR
jgi:hypothetical protein